MYFRRANLLPAMLFVTTMLPPVVAQTRSTTKTSKQPQPAAAAQPAPAETKPPAWSSWDTFKPENEDFSILMPKDTTTEITKFDYHKLELNARLYLSAPATGPVVGVASMSGIKSNPAAYSDFERFNSYADAFKTFLPPKVRKDAVVKMIMTGTKPLHGYNGRVYKLTVGDLSGTVNAYVTRKRFYAIAVLNTKKDDALEDKFLSSFVIPDKPTESNVATNEASQEDPNAIAQSENAAQQKPAQGRKPRIEVEGVGTASGGGGGNTPNAPSANTQEDNVDSGSATGQPGAQNQSRDQGTTPPRAPIAGGMLNAKAIYLPLPEMPPGEKAGVVMVQIIVDEQGSVISARAVSGPPNLQAAAVNAARLARFLPTVLSGEPVKVSGTLAYNFARAN